MAANNEREETKRPAVAPKRDYTKRKTKKVEMKNEAPKTCSRAEKWKLPTWPGESDSQKDAESFDKDKDAKGGLEGVASG